MNLVNQAIDTALNYACLSESRGLVYKARSEFALAAGDFVHAVKMGLPPTEAIETLAESGKTYLLQQQAQNALTGFTQAEQA